MIAYFHKFIFKNCHSLHMKIRSALIVGASGLIGGYCLRAILDDPAYTEVTVLVRKPIPITHIKLKVIVTDFSDLEQVLAPVSARDIFCCLGTTINKSGSQKAFRKIDLDLVLSVAGIMKRRGAEQFLVISSMGAARDAKAFYSRTKGAMELDLRGIGYDCLRILRPSLLLGKRPEFRLGERIGGMLAPLITPLMLGKLKRYAPVQAESVAYFMVKVAKDEPSMGVHIYESDLLR